MSKKAFDAIAAGLRDAIAIARGDADPSTYRVYPPGRRAAAVAPAEKPTAINNRRGEKERKNARTKRSGRTGAKD
jgi:hypothetical protein